MVRAIIKAKPPKKAINTSRISGCTRPKSSEVSSLKGKNLKNKKAVNKLSTIIIAKFINERFKVSISLIAIDKPTPKIGPISGEINMAPITTAVLFAFNPIEATNIEHTKIQAVAPLKGISFFIASIVASRSVSSLKSKSSCKKVLILLNKPSASFFTASFFWSTVSFCLSSSEKLNLFSLGLLVVFIQKLIIIRSAHQKCFLHFEALF